MYPVPLSQAICGTWINPVCPCLLVIHKDMKTLEMLQATVPRWRGIEGGGNGMSENSGNFIT